MCKRCTNDWPPAVRVRRSLSAVTALGNMGGLSSGRYQPQEVHVYRSRDKGEYLQGEDRRWRVVKDSARMRQLLPFAFSIYYFTPIYYFICTKLKFPNWTINLSKLQQLDSLFFVTFLRDIEWKLRFSFQFLRFSSLINIIFFLFIFVFLPCWAPHGWRSECRQNEGCGRLNSVWELHPAGLPL